jgi:hypothetical protein
MANITLPATGRGTATPVVPTTTVSGAEIQHVEVVTSAGAEVALATSTKQPALGTAGTASADVITVQGIASGTPAAVSQSTADAANTARTTATVVVPVQIVDSAGRSPKVDSTTKAEMVIDYAHHEIHSGSHFFVVGYQDLSINQVLDFTWVMPSGTKWTHWVWDLSTQSETLWLIYEGAVATNALANAVTPLNSDRNNVTDTSGTTMKYEVHADLTAANVDTNVTGATLIKSGISGTGKGGNGVAGRDSEIILKANTIYCLRAVATAAGFINFDMEWYEHTNS